jgi:hypothetical protein
VLVGGSLKRCIPSTPIDSKARYLLLSVDSQNWLFLRKGIAAYRCMQKKISVSHRQKGIGLCQLACQAGRGQKRLEKLREDVDAQNQGVQ